MRSLAVIAVVSLAGCNFAVKHPAVTVGIVAGSVGMGTCELGTSDRHGTCAALSAGGGLALALVVVVAEWLGYEDEPAAGPDGQPAVDPTNLEPAPVFVPTPDQSKQAPPAPVPAPPPDAPAPEPPPPPPPTPTPPADPPATTP